MAVVVCLAFLLPASAAAIPGSSSCAGMTTANVCRGSTDGSGRGFRQPRVVRAR